jgi:hypothetical protein
MAKRLCNLIDKCSLGTPKEKAGVAAANPSFQIVQGIAQDQMSGNQHGRGAANAKETMHGNLVACVYSLSSHKLFLP